MKKEITTKNNTSLDTREILYLLNLDNGRVIAWTTLLAVEAKFIDCKYDGTPINPSNVPGDHPWIIGATQHLHDRMRNAGADDESISHMGRFLTDSATRKFKALEYRKSKELYLGSNDNPIGPSIRISKRIDKRVNAAKNEIKQMVRQAMQNIHDFQ